MTQHREYVDDFKDGFQDGAMVDQIRGERYVTLKDIGIRWWYWLAAGTFGIAGIVSFLAMQSEPESVQSLVICGLALCTVSLLGFLWPILRTQESQGSEFISESSRRVAYLGTFIPISKVKLIIGMVGGSVFGIAALVFAFWADDHAIRVKAAIAFTGYTLVFVQFAYSLIRRRPGILLTQDGLVWNDYFWTTGLVEWSEISKVQKYTHKERYSNPPTLGLRFRDLALLRACPQSGSF